jgi:hypothetical protein
MNRVQILNELATLYRQQDFYESILLKSLGSDVDSIVKQNYENTFLEISLRLEDLKPELTDLESYYLNNQDGQMF